MFSSRINARSIVAPAAFGAVFLLIGAVNARAGSDDTGTFSAIGSAIGVTSSDGTIDYRERPKLVVPPDRKSLPEPRAGDDARPPSFPVDQGSPRRQGARAVSGQPVAPDEPSRENLTQPPPAYRHPSKPLSQLKEKEAKSWWNPMSYLGSGRDNSKETSAAATAQTSAPATAQTSSGATTQTSHGQAYSGPTAEKQASSWWNPMGYLPTFGSK